VDMYLKVPFLPGAAPRAELPSVRSTGASDKEASDKTWIRNVTHVTNTSAMPSVL
jgi:hypothetical protein